MTWGGRAEPREGQTFGGDSRLVRYANFVKLPHTLFALPFALLGVIVASYRYPVTGGTVALVVLAFTCARFVAMGFNRIADRDLDARNPRTRGRELVTGRLTLREAWVAVLLAAAGFVAASWVLNPLCGGLSLPALLWIATYSYAKRFTSWTHLWLGLALAIAPVGGYLAVAGTWSEPWWVLLALTAAVTAWVAGFDVFYALQDEDFDRAERLRSLVVRLGRPRAIRAAKLLHGAAILALVGVGAGAALGGPYYAGVALGAGVIAWEHQLVKPDDLSRLDAAFFTANGLVSILVFLGALVDRVW
ncbi:MAG TPA: 4-hydroxybenzoate octaprenyltransferase [Gemmatimonadales bacterium]|nr:4-hydroxybenzoate octaprenyltransferase [Gemmatimonadales bacterium]